MVPSFYTFLSKFALCPTYLSQTRSLPNCQVAAAPDSLQWHCVYWQFFGSDCKILQSSLCCLFQIIGSLLTMVIVLSHHKISFSQRNALSYGNNVFCSSSYGMQSFVWNSIVYTAVLYFSDDLSLVNLVFSQLFHLFCCQYMRKCLCTLINRLVHADAVILGSENKLKMVERYVS